MSPGGRTGIIIPVRAGATRLPGKALREVAPGWSALRFLVERLRRADTGAVIAIATTMLPEDDVIAEAAAAFGAVVHRGSVDDVLLRLTEAAVRLELEVVAEVDGDDLLCDAGWLDRAVAERARLGADFFMWDGLPLGVTGHVVTRAAMERSCREKAETDTSTGIFNHILRSGGFVVARPLVPGVTPRPEIRATLDYAEDLEFFGRVAAAFPGREAEFTLDEWLGWVEAHPEAAAVNGGLDARYWQHFNARANAGATRETTR